MLVRAHERVLGDVLGLAVVAHDRARDPIEALVVAAHEQLEECGFAAGHPLDDLLVGQAGELGCGHGLSRHSSSCSYRVGRGEKVPGNQFVA